MGLEQAGFDVVACVEYDPIHAITHAFNFPRTKVVCADVSRVSDETLRAAVREGRKAYGHDGRSTDVDVVIGGPPCQGFSVGGKLAVDDERNRLVFSYARAVGILRPRYFVMENVPAMRSAADARHLAKTGTPEPGTLLNALFIEFDRLGYDVCEEEVVNAQDFGVPQDRRRLILMGVLRGHPEPKLPSPQVRAVPKRSGGHLAAIRLRRTEGLPKGPTVGDAIGDVPDLDAYEALWKSDEVCLSPSAWCTPSEYAQRLRGTLRDAEDYSYPREWDPNILTSSLRTTHALKTIQRFGATAQGHSEPISRFYRLDGGGLCSTLRAGTGYDRGSFSAPRPIHPTRPRVISVREAARLHSFPDWFRMHATKWHGFRQVGNALPPLLARALGESLMRALDLAPQRPAGSTPFGSKEWLTYGMQDAAEHLGVRSSDFPSHALRTRSRRTRAEPADTEAVA